MIAEFAYLENILPNANTEYDLIHKSWMTVEGGQTFGSVAVYTPMLYNDDELLPDYLIVSWRDISIQPGKKSASDCSYVFMRSWWQEADVEQLIDAEKERQRKAKEENSEYEPSWDLKALEAIKGAIISKDDKAQNEAEQERSLDPSGIEIVTGFQVGVGATFYTFNPATENIVRRKQNKDPRGKIPISWYFYDADGANPLGRSVLELIGPLQNLIDGDMQAYQYNRAVALQPAINVFGNVNERRLNFGANAVNKIQDQNARIEPMNVDTTALREYPNLYGLQKSQMLNLVNSPDTSISAEVGNPGFGKTPQALKTQQAQLSIDDNALRKGFEAFFEEWSETAINLYFAERNGIEKMQLDDETADKLRALKRDGHSLDGVELDENNVATIDFSKAQGVLKFKIDASTTKVNSEAAQLDALKTLIQTLDSSQSLNQVVPIKKKLAARNAIVANSGIDGLDELKVTEEEMQEAQTQTAIPATDETAEQPVENEVQVTETPVEPQEDAEPSIVSELRQIGTPENLIAEVPSMIEKGFTEEEIIASIMGVIQKEEDE
nr:MAG TPA: portal [Bacteriophage sp.]